MTTDELVAKIGEYDHGKLPTLINRVAQCAVRWREADIAYSRQTKAGVRDFLPLVDAHEALDAAILALASALEAT